MLKYKENYGFVSYGVNYGNKLVGHSQKASSPPPHVYMSKGANDCHTLYLATNVTIVTQVQRHVISTA